jgi:hypothetical protein
MVLLGLPAWMPPGNSGELRSILDRAPLIVVFRSKLVYEEQGRMGECRALLDESRLTVSRRSPASEIRDCRWSMLTVCSMYVLEVTTGATLRVSLFRIAGTFSGAVGAYVVR